MERYVEFGAKTGNYFVRNIKIRHDQILAYIDKYNNTDVYLSAYTYSDDDIDKSDLLGNFYIDLDAQIDTEEEFLKIKTEALLIIQYLYKRMHVPFEYIWVHFSGAKGLHIVVPYQVFGITPTPFLNIIYKELVKEIISQTKVTLVDTSIYDKRRLFRIPYSINSKTGLYKTPIDPRQLYKITLKDFKEMAIKQCILERADIYDDVHLFDHSIRSFYYFCLKYHKKVLDSMNATHIDLSDAPEDAKDKYCLHYLIENGAGIGNRNNAMYFISNAWKCDGGAYDDLEEFLLDWNQKCDPPMTKSEIHATSASGFFSDKVCGCGFVRDKLGICDKSQCIWRQKRLEEWRKLKYGG